MTSQTLDLPLLPFSDSAPSDIKHLIQSIRLVVFDFDGVFTDNMVYVFEDGREAVRCFRSDGIGLRALEGVGVTPVILSTETNPAVRARAEKLRVRCIHGVKDKLDALLAIMTELECTLDQTAFVGNDINDADCLCAVSLPIVVNDAHASVLPLARFRTQTRGGYGAVREVCDLFAGLYAIRPSTQ